MLSASLQLRCTHHVAYIVHKQNNTYIYKSHNICLEQKCKDKCDNKQNQTYQIRAQKCLICFLSLLIFRTLLLTPSFLSTTCQSTSGLCFLACSTLKKHTTCVFSLAYMLLHTQLSPRYLSTSFRFVFSRLLYHEKTHDMCFFTCLFAFTHSFLPATCQPASGLCFLACSTMKKHTTCVFSLAYLLLHTIFSPLPAYQLPGWVFSLAFLYPSPRRGFFRSLTTPHAQFFPRYLPISFWDGFSRLLFSIQAHVLGFSAHLLLLTPSFVPRYLPISFRAGFSRLLFSTYTHAVGFSARILLLTPSFSPATCLSTSGMGFLACFSLPAPTPWVFPLAFYSSRPAFSPLPANQLSGHVFTLANTRACKNATRLGIPNAWRFINSKLILLFRLKGIHCRSTEAGTKVQSSSLLPRLQHRSRQSQPETSQSQAPYP